VAGLPRLISDVVFEALHQPPELVVTATDDAPITAPGSRLVALLTSGGADAAVVGIEGIEQEIAVADLAVRHPRLVVLGLSLDGRQAWLVRVKTELVPLDEVSPDGLRRSLRLAVEARV
jgi:hypothetical protein